jgi:hypothetical protein
MRWLRNAICLGLCLGLIGCSPGGELPKVAKVKGKVTRKGQPVSGGEVVFTPVAGMGGQTGQVATGQIRPDGTYTLTTFNTGDGAILGTHKVTVTVRAAEDMRKINEMPGGAIAYKLPKSQVPDKYSSVATTPLTYTVQDGENEINIELEE